MAENSSIEEGRQARIAETLFSYHTEQGHEMILQVKGWSMGGILAPSKEVLVRPLRHPPFFGDVVLVRAGPRFVVHRVIGRVSGRRDLIVTKGDNCRQSDPPVRQTEIAGRVIGIKEPDGFWIPWQWRFPVSYVVSLLSYLEARGFPVVTVLLQRILDLNQRAQRRWNRYKRRRVTIT